MPSPVPTSCSRKSLYGWKFLSPIAAGMVYLPPLTMVPAGEVVIVGIWQMLQPIWLNSDLPAITSDVPAATASGAGALSERMKRVKAPTSTPKGSAVVAWSSGSGTVSNAAVEAPFGVFSVGCSGLRSEEHTSELQSRQ